MEDTLRGARLVFTFNTNVGLNPCFNGRYSQRESSLSRMRRRLVLILVLMEDTLRAIEIPEALQDFNES